MGLASTPGVIAAPVPADVCIRALQAAGFVVRRRGGGIALLARGPRMVVVPDLPALDPNLVGSILRSANLDPTEFRQLVARQSGMFSKVELAPPSSRDHISED